VDGSTSFLSLPLFSHPYTVSKKTVKIVFRITLSNFHQLW